MLWAVLTFLLVATTKYLTSMRLRNLREKIHKDQQAASELRELLEKAMEKESVLKEETNGLMTKITIMSTVVSNLERSLQRSGTSAYIGAGAGEE